MYAVGARLVVLEKTINCLAGERLLFWETELSPRFHGIRSVGNVPQPGIFLFFYEFVLITIGLFAIPSFTAYRFWNFVDESQCNMRWIIACGFLYSFISFILMLYVSISILLRFREQATEIANDISGLRESAETKPVST